MFIFEFLIASLAHFLLLYGTMPSLVFVELSFVCTYVVGMKNKLLDNAHFFGVNMSVYPSTYSVYN